MHVSMLDALEARLNGPNPRRFRVGMAMPASGLLAMNAPSVIEAMILAAQEINANPGERAIELVLVDSGGSVDAAASAITDLAESGTVDAFVGLHTSATLEAVEQRIRNPLPYMFVPGYEGAQRRPGYFCAGETPYSNAPGMHWLMRERGIREWAIVGTDYVWPRAVRDAAHKMILSNGGSVVLDRLIPLGAVATQIDGFLDALIASRAEGVVINMPGRDLVLMLTALRQRGLDEHVVRFPTALEENVLYAIDGDRTGNLYSVLHSFNAMKSARRLELNDKHRAAFGEYAPVMTNWAEHAYDGLHLLATLDERGLLSPTELVTGEEGAVVRAVHHPVYHPHLALAIGLSFMEIPLVD
jgi:ABC-type branched-subunit amino acid transport system substrate-binding protein